MKILHSADLHLGSPFSGRTGEQAAYLRRELLKVPEKLARLCKQEQCRMMLLAGDLFDGDPDWESVDALRDALEEAGVPVFISPGNHDPFGPHSPYSTVRWPSNVHIFSRPMMEAVSVRELDCRVYGAGYRSMDCGSVLEGFLASGEERFHVAVLHGDPTSTASPYCPVTRQQIQESGLHYLALGHIHKGGSVLSGETLCAWPGCPMGRGFDEPGVTGALVVTLEHTAETRFVPLDTPEFFDLEATLPELPGLLPAVGNQNFYRVTLVGEADTPDPAALAQEYSRFPNLELRDRTVPRQDIWGTAGNDSLEGVYFRLLKEAMDGADDETRRAITLAARISRQILDGQEVKLP